MKKPLQSSNRLSLSFCFFALFFSLSCFAQRFDSVGMSVNGKILAMIVYKGELYVGGKFDKAGGKPALNIAKWNGKEWSAVGTGSHFTVRAMAILNDMLYIGGGEKDQRDSAYSIVNMWDGTTWKAVPGLSALGTPDVYSLYADGGKLYATGYFDHAGDIEVNNIAVWDGATWNSTGLVNPSEYMSTCVNCRGTLYACGSKLIFHRKPYIVIDKHNHSKDSTWSTDSILLYYRTGDNWMPIGAKVNDQQYVFSMQVIENEIYFGKDSEVAKWDGTNMKCVGQLSMEYPGGGFEIKPQIRAVMEYNGRLFVGGYFYAINGVVANCVAACNEHGKWHALGKGANSDKYNFLTEDVSVDELVVYNGDLYIAGSFEKLNGMHVANIARYSEPVPLIKN